MNIAEAFYQLRRMNPLDTEAIDTIHAAMESLKTDLEKAQAACACAIMDLEAMGRAKYMLSHESNFRALFNSCEQLVRRLKSSTCGTALKGEVKELREFKAKHKE